MVDFDLLFQFGNVDIVLVVILSQSLEFVGQALVLSLEALELPLAIVVIAAAATATASLRVDLDLILIDGLLKGCDFDVEGRYLLFVAGDIGIVAPIATITPTTELPLEVLDFELEVVDSFLVLGDILVQDCYLLVEGVDLVHIAGIIPTVAINLFLQFLYLEMQVVDGLFVNGDLLAELLVQHRDLLV